MKKNELTPTPVIQTDKIHLTNIVLLKCAVNCTDLYINHPDQPDKIVMNLGSKPMFDFDHNRCRFSLHITLEGQDASGTVLGMDAEFFIDFVFIIENLADFFIPYEDDFRVHSILGATLLGISFSTARGIVIERTKGTPLAGFILPVINPSQALFNSAIEPLSSPKQAKLAASGRRKKNTT